MNTKPIDEFFERLEKDPYAGLPDGSSKEDIKLAMDIKYAYMLIRKARREITVLTSKIETVLKQMESLMMSIMENPATDPELIFESIKSMQLEVKLMQDQITNNEWDEEFYKWWLEEVESGNPHVVGE